MARSLLRPRARAIICYGVRVIPTSRPLPERLGRFDVLAKIGEGGMAAVYLGHAASAAGDQVVAIKVIKEELSLNTDFVMMFMDEARIISRLNHPNIVRVHELGNEGSRLFLAMELLFGQSLWHVWNACRERGVRLRYDVACWIGARVAEGLHHAHELRDEKGQFLNVVHRDVNASNVFVTYDGHVKIIDFGLAKAANRVSKTAAGVVKGKLAYMSPEQAVGNPLDRRSDLFALATTLWEVTVDRRLFKGSDDIDTLKRVHAADVPDPTKLVEGFPPYLWNVLRKALAREPVQRYQTGLDMARELDACARAEGREVTPLVLKDIMGALFAHEQQRQGQWLQDASSGNRAAPREAMQTGTVRMHAVETPRNPIRPQTAPMARAMWPQGQPPEGMFGPPSRPNPQHDATWRRLDPGVAGGGPQPSGPGPSSPTGSATAPPGGDPWALDTARSAPSQPSRAVLMIVLVVSVLAAIGLGVGAALYFAKR
jgi:serine/threonine-protein kinase